MTGANGSAADLAPQDPAVAAGTDLFAGPGAMRERCRALDWGATPLGAVEGWPSALRAIVGLVLDARQPMILWCGPELVQVYNDAYRPILGTDRHPAALGARGREFWADAWPVVGPELEAMLVGGPATWHEDRPVPILRDGVLRDAYWTYGYTPVRDAGRVVGILNTVVETTAHVLARRAEAERVQAAAEHQAERIDLLEEVFHHSPAFLHVLSGPTFVVEMANEAYYALVGRRDLLGRPAFEAMPEAAAGGFPERLARVMTTGEPFIGRELPVTLARTPGAPPEERLIDLVYLPLVDAEGRHTRILGHGVDVTEHVRERQAVETALAERTAAAEAANRAKTDFLAVMSHELRTPLNAIGGYAQLMELGLHGPVTPEQLAALARIQRGQQHLLGLINSVLNYAKLEAGHVAYATADVPVGTALAEVAALIAPQAHAKGLTLTVEPCAPTLTARADPEKVRQVLLNLLSNAVKFSDRGEKITTGCGAATDGYLALRVSDTGRGIPADQLKRVFQPFVQIDAQLTRTEEGTGLGLAISHDLARGMGGTLTAESTPGVGSTFTLMLPAAG